MGDSFHGKKASHRITAFAAENAIILGQLRTAAKSNEITAIPELLNTLALKGCVVTIDAMGCQRAITKKIGTKKAITSLESKGIREDFVMKRSFFDQVIDVGAKEAGCSYAKTIEKGQGRIEEREVRVSSDLEWLEGMDGRMGWAQVLNLCKIHSA